MKRRSLLTSSVINNEMDEAKYKITAAVLPLGHELHPYLERVFVAVFETHETRPHISRQQRRKTSLLVFVSF